MCSAGWGRSISRCINALSERRAQATVEAAVLLPCFLLVLLLALQPVCLLYTRAIMESAAGEAARLMVTAQEDDDDAYRAFIQRRLAAIPNLSIFHAGGPLSWDITLGRASDRAGEVAVSIEGAVSPLPVLGVFAAAAGPVNAQGDVVLRVEVSYDGRPRWLEGSYETWVGIWDGP